jgi:hypothetical protein
VARQDRGHEGHRGLTPSRAGLLAGAGALALGAGAVLLVDPTDGGAIPCPLHALTGIDCPGCGATRATWFLLHGDLGDALRANLLLVPVGLWLAGWWLHAMTPARTPWLARITVPIGQRAPRVRYVLAALVVVFAVARNLPGPDAWLAPPSS